MKMIELLWKVKNAKAGNHKLQINGKGIKNLIYYSTTICKVNPYLMVFATTTGGYNTVSTKRAIGKYRNELLSSGYIEIEDINDIRLD